TVNAVPADVAALLVEKGKLQSITSDITLEEKVQAPVSKGQRLGMLTIKAGEQVLSQIPLVAEARSNKP
ncbi:MAG: D-alanyl-D-alanine carboxypeptidase, partial [Clostridia bacterium]|nr:D-alanyl-D-alanine carboxypeptidase [Clostridia bacterium]